MFPCRSPKVQFQQSGEKMFEERSLEHSVMGYKAWVSTLMLVCALLLSGCGQQEAQLEDDAGVTLSDVESMSLKYQYQLAEERYDRLNEFFGEVQTEISDEDWTDSGASSEIVPDQGSALGRAPEGATRDNSYYFTVSRWDATEEEDLRDLMASVAESWQAHGWDVAEQNTQASSASRLTALTPDGYWFALEEDRTTQELQLTSHSPVYWGDRRSLSRAISERREAQTAAGETWATADRDEETRQAVRRPGEYRPFPDWGILDNYTPEPTNSPKPWE